MRVCSAPGCPNLYAGSASRCPTHRREADKARRPDGNPYSSRGHRAFRSAVLAKDPICVLCLTAFATVADHWPLSRKELEQQGLNPNGPEHGRGLCVTCHNQQTAANQPGGWNA